VKKGIWVSAILLILFGAYLSPDLWSNMAKEALRAAGLPTVSFHVQKISTSGITFSGIRIGTHKDEGLGLEIPNLEATFLWAELFNGEIGTLKVEGLRLSGKVNNGQLSFGALDGLLFRGAKKLQVTNLNTQVSLPFRSLLLKDAVISMAAQQATINITLSGLVSKTAKGGIFIHEGLMSIATPWGQVSGRADASLSAEKEFKSTLSVEDGHYTYGGLSTKGLFGKIDISGNIDNLLSFLGDGQLGIKTLSVPYLGDSRALMVLGFKEGRFDSHFILKPQSQKWISGELFTSIDLTQSGAGLVNVSAKVFGEDVTQVLSSQFVSGGQVAAEVSVSSSLNDLSSLAQKAFAGNLGTLPTVFFSSTLADLKIGPCHTFGGTIAFELHPSPTSLKIQSSNGGTVQVTSPENDNCNAFKAQGIMIQQGQSIAEISLNSGQISGDIQFAAEFENPFLKSATANFSTTFSSAPPFTNLTGRSNFNGYLNTLNIQDAKIDANVAWMASKDDFEISKTDCLNVSVRSIYVPDLKVHVDGVELCADVLNRSDLSIQSQKKMTVRLDNGDRFQVHSLKLQKTQNDWTLNAGSLLDLQSPPRFTPLTLSAKATYLDPSINFSGHVRGTQDLKVEFSGSHDVVLRRGQGTGRLIPLRFQEKGLSPADLSPLYGAQVQKAKGLVMAVLSADWTTGRACARGDALLSDYSLVPASALTGGRALTVKGGQIVGAGKLCFDGNELTQSATVLVENLDIIDEMAELNRLNTVVKFKQLWPPITDGVQDVSFGVLNVGFPLTNGTASFDITDQQQVLVSNVALDWAGGTVAIDPFQTGLLALPESLDVYFTDLQLKEFLNIFQVNGLTGDGLLEGRLPIQKIEDEFRIVNGRLEAKGGGRLSYQPKDALSSTAQIAVDALSDFRYSTLSIGIEGGAKSEATITLNAEGHNPQFYDGFPVVLDFNIKGQIGRIMNDGLAAYKVPAHIQDRMNRFGE